MHERAFGDLTLIEVLFEQFFRASKRCLDIAQWTTKPQFRVLMWSVVIYLLSVSLAHFLSPSLLSYINILFYSLEVTEGLIWQPAAMRLAELLGIHKLGSDPTTMPTWDDLAFPTGPSFRKRQLCCRAWHALLFTDGLFSLDFGFSTCTLITLRFTPPIQAFKVTEPLTERTVTLPDHDTALPLNFDDADLLIDDLHYSGKVSCSLASAWKAGD